MAARWDPMPGESDKAYAAFCTYRDLGPRRSLDEASRRYHQSSSQRPRCASGTIRRWAQRWNWQTRARAWDQETERVKQAEQQAAVLEMTERHAREALMLQNKAIERLRQLRPEEMKTKDVLAYLVESAKLERLSRGQPTERIAEEHAFEDLKELSDDELTRIIARGQQHPPAGSRGAAAPQNGTQELP